MRATLFVPFLCLVCFAVEPVTAQWVTTQSPLQCQNESMILQIEPAYNGETVSFPASARFEIVSSDQKSGLIFAMKRSPEGSTQLTEGAQISLSDQFNLETGDSVRLTIDGRLWTADNEPAFYTNVRSGSKKGMAWQCP